MKVKIQLRGGILPTRATSGAAAYDLYVPEDVVLRYGRQIIDMKFGIELPQGYAATIQPRSGFSSKGIEVEEHLHDKKNHIRLTINGCEDEITTERINGDVLRGLIDSDYRGNVGVILNIVEIGCGYDDLWYFVLKKGTRIAQMQIIEVPQVELVEVDELSETDRGEGGFGHTGTR